jgi:autotransporter-associated beta strand protein
MTSSGAFNIGNITVSSGVNVNFTAASGTVSGNGSVRTIDVASGATIDFNTQAFSTAAGNGWIKSGAGVLALAGGGYTGGFRLDAGTAIARGVDAFGAGGSNILTLNGGTIASNATRSFANTKYGGGIVIGGNVQFGELATVVSLASSSANLSFANNVNLGSATRTLTQGNNGVNTFSGVISNTSGGLTFAANSGTDGRFEITNTTNTFTGDINVNGGEVRFTTNGSMGNAANDIVIDGGRFSKANDSTTVTLGAGRTIAVGDGVGTGISSPGSGTLIYNGEIANKSGETGSWAKQGGGILELGGVSTYTGDTAINNGTVRLTTGNDRLPTTTTLTLGQAASANLGTLDINGFNQQIAGVSSVTGTSAAANNNIITSTNPATLTLGGSGSYSYGDGTAANSGIITGAIALLKSGLGTQTLGDENAYTGGTTISGGTLNVTNGSGSATGSGALTLDSTGTLSGTGIIAPATNTNINLNGSLVVGNSTLGSPVASSITLTTSGSGVTTTSTSSLFHFDLFTRIGGSNPLGSAADYIKLPGTLNNTSVGPNLGTIVITNRTGGTTFALGDSWHLFDFTGGGTITDDFNVDYANLGLSGDLIGQFDRLSGTFSIVPEPSRTLFLALGLLTLTLRRRR